ncbi:flagellar biosynthetic protein FliR [Rhodobacter ferrooxidans]|uniref:Type III secretion system inner membrane R protein n=1 Tax=Rhodobacter ferrooxidans TaxID=371731 RepID=C8RX58_9RHOB|nr:flagellar biosynthetic protein FliR [Rhodobacter sp. SW2]EEW26583.1 type III secretion system inner membrane R protein [Rhodobacter sp. SW2]
MNDLIATLTQLSGLGQDLLWTGFLVLLRVGAAMALLPAFGEQSVPVRVRLVLALAFTAIVAPAVATEVVPLAGSIALPLATEVMAGLIIGIGLRLFIHALQIAGAIAAQAASLSQLFAGAGAEPQPAIGNLLTMAGLALAVMAGLHVRMAELFIQSYQVFPAGRLPNSADLADWGLFQIGRVFSLGFVLASPFVIASLIYNVALGIINRAMPQLMVAFVGAPALTLGGLALLAIVTPLGLMLWSQAFDAFLAAPFEVAP